MLALKRTAFAVLFFFVECIASGLGRA